MVDVVFELISNYERRMRGRQTFEREEKKILPEF